jgi:heptose I phosphotransferase
MSHGSFWGRLSRGTRWAWVSGRHRDRLPPDLDAIVMDLESGDRHHAKQGRSTCRVRFDSPGGSISVYLKRHDRLPWHTRLAALINPRGQHSPGAAERAHLERARTLGIAVPEVVAVGERIGPWGALQSYLMVLELTGCLPLHEAIPALAESLDAAAFATLKREVIAEVAAIAATLHRARVFHKDLYLCHFFLDVTLQSPRGRRLHLIDLHRLGHHRWTAMRWRGKDLGQLLYSTFDVAGIDDRDRLRFWKHYRRALRLRWPRMQRALVRGKARRYLEHNRPSREPGRLIEGRRCVWP